MRHFKLRDAIVLVSAMLLLPLAGCDTGPDGPVRFETSGVVLSDGKPVPKAQVVFYLPEHKVSRGAITDENGKFRVKAATGNGLPAGEYKVAVRPAPEGEEVMFDIVRPDIPVSYRRKETSPLTTLISEGDNHVELKLTR